MKIIASIAINIAIIIFFWPLGIVTSLITAIIWIAIKMRNKKQEEKQE